MEKLLNIGWHIDAVKLDGIVQPEKERPFYSHVFQCEIMNK